MRSSNKFRLKYILEFLYNVDTNCSLALEVSSAEKAGSQRTPPPRVRMLRLNEIVHQ